MADPISISLRKYNVSFVIISKNEKHNIYSFIFYLLQNTIEDTRINYFRGWLWLYEWCWPKCIVLPRCAIPKPQDNACDLKISRKQHRIDNDCICKASIVGSVQDCRISNSAFMQSAIDINWEFMKINPETQNVCYQSQICCKVASLRDHHGHFIRRVKLQHIWFW